MTLPNQRVEATWDSKRRPNSMANVIADVIFIYYMNKVKLLGAYATHKGPSHA